MTDSQRLRVREKKQEYLANMRLYSFYGAEKYVSFKIMKSTDPIDTSITIVSNLIEDINDNSIPFTKQVFYNIVEDGSFVTLDLILTTSEIGDYISTLIPIDNEIF
jgi:hypothetical protein